MAESNLEKTLAVVQAIRAQDVDGALRYVDPSFVQHYPHMAAGADGLRRYVTDSAPEELKLSIVRAIEDGSYVVTQLKLEFSGENMFAVYRFHKGLIAEHWAFTSPGAPPNESGHTQLDGPVEPQHLEETERNKAFVRRYYEAFHLKGRRDQNDDFFAGDLMIRHEPGVRDGLGEFLRDVAVLMQHRTIDEIKLLVGQGDLMFLVAKGTHEEKPCAYVDLYRIENQKIVEHWGFPQVFPSAAEARNNEGML